MSPSTLDPALDAVLDVMRVLPAPVSVLDLGGGSGRNAVPLARAGAGVTVVDRSADALATLVRRSEEAEVADRVVGVQADVETVAVGSVAAVPVSQFSIVVCHDVLAGLDDPSGVLGALVAQVPALSVVVANPQAAVIGRALAGQPRAARDLLHQTATGSAPDLGSVTEIVQRAGLQVRACRGLDIFAGRVPSNVLDLTPGARAELTELDRELADAPAYRALAARLQVVAVRPPAADQGRASDGI